jgi:hypothetical protein
VAGVEDGGQAHTGLEGFYDVVVDLVVDDVASGLVVDGIDYFVVAVVFVAS